MKTLEESFWSKVDKSGECWIWRGPLRKGRPVLTVGRKTRSARAFGLFGRACFTRCNPPTIATCINARCVNPDHVYTSSRSEFSTRFARPSYSRTNRKLKYDSPFLRSIQIETENCILCKRDQKGKSRFGYLNRSKRWPGICRWCAEPVSRAMTQQKQAFRKTVNQVLGEAI